MKLILVLFTLLIIKNVFTDEKVDSTLEEEEVTVTAKKITFTKPNIPDNYFLMYFTAPSNLAEHLVASQAAKEGVEEVIAKYNGIWSVEVPQSSAIDEDYALVLKSKARHAAISAKLTRPFDFTSDQLVVQYEVKFQNGQECGGAYIKLLSHSDDLNLKQFHDKSQYTIMFGPDRCGNDNKLHFIFQHKNPKTGKYEEKHAKKPSTDIERHFTDKKTHLYTLVLNADNTFEIYIDQGVVNSGHLLKDFEPPVNAPKEIDDPTDIKPNDWDDIPKIPDISATKPNDWNEDAIEYIEDTSAQKPDGWLEDEALTVADEKAEKPTDWDDEMDGEWEAPRVDNPLCKSAPGCGPWTAPKMKNPEYRGKWSAPLIDNPSYKGVWKARRIQNPDYFEDATPYRMTAIGAVGLELWSMSDEIAFDNFLIVDNKKAADDYAAETWVVKKDAERMADPNAQSVVDAIREATSERPWLWLVIVGVIVLPIVLIVIYCCRSSSPSRSPVGRHGPSASARAMHKKDDDVHVAAVVEDGEEEEEEESLVNETGDKVAAEVGSEGQSSVATAEGDGQERTTKGDLESDESGDDDEDVEAVEGVESKQARGDSEGKEEEASSSDRDDSANGSTNNNIDQTDGHGAKKRRPRKD